MSWENKELKRQGYNAVPQRYNPTTDEWEVETTEADPVYDADVLAKIQDLDEKIQSIIDGTKSAHTQLTGSTATLQANVQNFPQEQIVKPKNRYIPSEIRPEIITTMLSDVAQGMRPLYMEEDGTMWGNRDISSLSLVRATRADLSDATVVATLPGGASNIWRNIIRVKPGKLVAYVMSSDPLQAGFYTINDSDPLNVTYTKVHDAFPNGNPDPVLQTFEKAGNGKYIWAITYGTKDETNPLYYIYRSVDYGDTWEEVYTHIVTANTHMHAVAWDAWRNRIWVCVGDENSGGRPGILYSDEFGASGTWNFIEAEVGQPSHMLISIVPLPDKVLFGTDRVPAGTLQWKPSEDKLIYSQPPVENTDIVQTFFAQPQDELQNLGFAGRPHIGISSYPYNLVLPYGHSASYSEAWIWISPDGENFYTVDYKEDAPENPLDWMRYCIGITPDGWVIGVSSWTGIGTDKYFRFKMPSWRKID